MHGNYRHAEFFQGSSILITGGSGSIGTKLIQRLLQEELGVRRIAIFSRDELKQSELRKKLCNDDRLRWFIGDIRDLSRLNLALKGVDYLIHAAALKHVDIGEYNPTEFIKTNVYGSQNVIEAALQKNVKKIVALSTDKASSPINLYGATKLTADKLFISANNYATSDETKFSVVRYGNVSGSRGSVIPLFMKLLRDGSSIPVTDVNMTRFWITIDQAVHFILDSFIVMNGGELFIPKIPSMRLMDLVKALNAESNYYVTGLRPGEKLHEEMISIDDARQTVDYGDRYAILPNMPQWDFKFPDAKVAQLNGAYASNDNLQWVTVEEIQKFIDDFAE